MAVMPRDQMSHSSLYPPLRATAATSGAILEVETLREPEVAQGQGEGRWGTERARYKGRNAESSWKRQTDR
jgi:hypothetical protein